MPSQYRVRTALPHFSDALGSPRINRGPMPRGNGAVTIGQSRDIRAGAPPPEKNADTGGKKRGADPTRSSAPSVFPAYSARLCRSQTRKNWQNGCSTDTRPTRKSLRPFRVLQNEVHTLFCSTTLASRSEGIGVVGAQSSAEPL